MEISLKESLSAQVHNQGIAIRAGGAVSSPLASGKHASSIDVMRLRSSQSVPQSQVSAVLGALLQRLYLRPV